MVSPSSVLGFVHAFREITLISGTITTVVELKPFYSTFVLTLPNIKLDSRNQNNTYPMFHGYWVHCRADIIPASPSRVPIEQITDMN